MNISNNFKSNRIFRIWMYTVSHSTLILRSEKQYVDVNYDFKYDDPEATIDLIFSAVDFISIPEWFDAVEIKKHDDKFIFNNNENWFVKAAFCNVGKYSGENQDDIWHRNLEYDEVINIK